MDMIRTGYTDTKFYFVGFGVGANMAGSVARELNKGSQQNFKIGRLTALDPFMPSNYAYGNLQSKTKTFNLF